VIPRGGGAEARQAAGPGTTVVEIERDASGEIRLAGAASGSCRSPADDEVALVLHTSGTTSRPKRVPLTHANLTVSAKNIADTYKLTAEDVSLCVMPLFHVHGLVGSTLATFYSGGTVVVPPAFNALSFWPLAEKYRATWFSAVPAIHLMLLARAKGQGRPAGAERLRFIRSCSSALAPATMAELESRFGVPVLEAYGMTEASHQMASNPLPPAARLPGSVGAGTGVDIAIMNDQGALLGAGAQGEVVIRGPNVTRGYEDNPEANAASFTAGWFRTGDEGILDAAGYLRLVGRIKELIVRGGEKISPREIDELLALHPAVSEVVTFGAPHRIYGEEVAAAVVLKAPATEAELIAWCRRQLADFKCPQTIHIVEKIPRTATGKVQRRNVAAALNT
jgi:acyl-CoA synthetase (AMP-forming)/AMP-acid ligase II